MKKFFIYILFFGFIFVNTNKSFCDNGFWPFYFKSEFNNSTHILGPFFEKKEDSFIFRPFFLHDQHRTYFLYPLGEFSEENGIVTKKFLPFFNKKYNKNKAQEEKFTSFLLFFWGKSEKNENFGGMFPLYGRLLDMFDYNEINFVLWPLYTKKIKNEDIDYNILWPFLGWSCGNKNYVGLKIWPLFGFKTKKNYFSRKFFLWPFFIFQDKKIGPKIDDWEHKAIFFPFYIHTYSKNYNYKTFLWPFFRFNQRGEYKSYGFPWPFFTYESNKKWYKISVFPFYKEIYQPERESFNVLWIFFSHSEIFDKNRINVIEEKSSFLLINRFEKNYKNKSKYINFWPFFEYAEEKDNYVFKFLELFPFKIKGFYELYSPFFNIFYIVKKGDKKKVSFLWGLITYTRNKEKKCFSLFKIIKFRWGSNTQYNNQAFQWYLTYEIGT